MKFIILILVITASFNFRLWSQNYPDLLEKVDLTQVQRTSGIIPENTIIYDSVVADIINKVNPDSLNSFVRILSGEDSVWIGGNRVLISNRGGIGGNLAASYIKQKLSSYNLETYEQNYSNSGKNVYAVQKGYLYPDEEYIICAHYDAVNFYCADDNASGTAAVIEAARILSNYNLKYTLIYALWDEEEIGLVGSDYYASGASLNQDQIAGVLNMDMLGWDGNNDGLLDIHTRDIASSNYIANTILMINDQYGLQLNPVVYNPGTWASDHSVFWNHGYGAVLLIEAYFGGDLNPYYHTIDDRIDKFDLNYFYKSSKLGIGSIATLTDPMNLVGIDDELERPISFALYQNYPNPFNPITTIRYSIPELSRVSLRIFNVLGEDIITLIDEDKNKGDYVNEFDAGGLPSGIYFYKLTAGDYTSVKKMLLLK